MMLDPPAPPPEPKAPDLGDVLAKLDVLIDRLDALNYNLGFIAQLLRDR